MIDIKAKQVSDGNYVFHDALTNDPIAVGVAKSPPRYGGDKKKRFTLSWHPDARLIHPLAQHLVHMNFESMSGLEDAKSHVSNKYTKLLDGTKKDPIDTKYVGATTTTYKSQNPYNDDYSRTTDNFHILHEGKHIATLHVIQDKTKYIGLNNGRFDNYMVNDKASGDATITFHGEQPTPEKLRISQLKHPGNDPISLLHQVKHWVENKHIVPNFVGHTSHHGYESFKTPLSPEKASEEYMKYMQNAGAHDRHTFTRLTPTIFHATYIPPANTYETGSHETIDTSQSGLVRHFSLPTFAETHHLSQPSNVVID
jgi:hypothetical protein